MSRLYRVSGIETVPLDVVRSQSAPPAGLKEGGARVSLVRKEFYAEIHTG